MQFNRPFLHVTVGSPFKKDKVPMEEGKASQGELSLLPLAKEGPTIPPNSPIARFRDNYGKTRECYYLIQNQIVV